MRRQIILPVVRGVAALLAGYGAVVLLTSFGFNFVLGGRPLYGNSPLLLAAGMLVAIIAGLVGGYIAGLIGPGRGLFNAALVLVPLTGDTIYVLFFFNRSTAPFWFDAVAAVTLMAFTVCGGLIVEKPGQRRSEERES